MKKIILASTSPRRQELMEDLGLIFDIIPPSFEENLVGLKFSNEAIEFLALNKAQSVLDEINISAIVIGADTVVILDEKILGKPKDPNQAKKMLKDLQNKTHKVVTSIAVINTQTGQKITESTVSYVTFNPLTDEQIDDYVDNYNPLDKAGAYGIQEVPVYFVKTLDGDFDNIMGLPTRTLIKMLAKVN